MTLFPKKTEGQVGPNVRGFAGMLAQQFLDSKLTPLLVIASLVLGFIAIVGISAGPGFVNGLKTQGAGLFLWGALATTLPLVLGMFIAKYLFRFHDALTLGIVSGAAFDEPSTKAAKALVADWERQIRERPSQPQVYLGAGTARWAA